MSSLAYGSIMICRIGEVSSCKFSKITVLKLVNSPDKQLLVHEESAEIIINAIAVGNTLALPRLLIFIQIFLPYAVRSIRRMSHLTHRRPERDPGRVTSYALRTLQEAESIGSAMSGLTRDHLAMEHLELGAYSNHIMVRCRKIYSNFQEDRLGFSVVCLMVLALAAFYVGVQATAILTTGIMSSNYGIPASPLCREWLPAKYFDLSISIALEEAYEAVAYAEAQYSNATGWKPASGFVRPKLDYQEYRDQACPFALEYCDGKKSAITLDTGIQDAKVLGFNTAERYSFRKKMTCAPLQSRRLGSLDLKETYNVSSLYGSMSQFYQANPGDSYDHMQVMRDEHCDHEGYFYR